MDCVYRSSSLIREMNFFFKKKKRFKKTHTIVNSRLCQCKTITVRINAYNEPVKPHSPSAFREREKKKKSTLKEADYNL